VKTIAFQFFLSMILLVLLSLTSVMAQTTSSVIKFNVKLKNNTTVEMGATVIYNPASQRKRNTILVLNGTSQTSNNFKDLAESVLASDGDVSRMILLDYPGHGNSGFPVGGTKFGDLTMDDYVNTLLGALTTFSLSSGSDYKPNVILAHSLGAELTQMLQTKLVKEGTSLREKFGIRAAIFIASDIPGPLPWFVIDIGAADMLAELFVREDRNLGSVFDLLTLPEGPEMWISFLYYADRNGNTVPGAPTPDEALSKGFISLESASMAKQLVGFPTTPGGPRNPRPQIEPKIFSPKRGTLTAVVTLEQDILFLPGEHRSLYSFITGDESYKFFYSLAGPTTVHNVQTIEPKIYNEIIKKVLVESLDY
jgi:pimeloyl-ACP methyl ester carboxylesterase